MKTKLLKPIRSSKWLLVLSLLFLATACKDGKKSTPENKSGSAERTDLCELLNEDLIKTTFNLSSEVVLKKDDGKNICSYEWSVNDGWYSISLNFARGGQRSDSSAQAVWESQNKGIYADKNMQEVTGVGDKATWSNLGGSQLRVLYDGYIFYISLMDYPDDPAMTTQKMIEKLTLIAEGVIEQL